MAALYGAIFLRPALHTIGLMLAFALCNITLAYFNGLWWGTMKNSIASDWDVFDLVMMVGGYPLLLCGLLVYCMKAVNLYANNIMSWIATEAIGQFGDADSYANESMNTIKSMGGAMNGALKGGGDKAGGRNNPTRKPGGNDNTDVKDERPPTASK
jgi:hypothetical protein